MLFLFSVYTEHDLELMVSSVPDTNTYVNRIFQKCSLPTAFQTGKKWNPVDELNTYSVSPLTLTNIQVGVFCKCKIYIIYYGFYN